jgi:choline dehydrogenase
MESAVGDGRRSSSARAYLHPAMARPNLTIETGALVHRIVVRGGRAIGVQYIKRGRSLTVIANSEVILSAGAYQSPQVLMLSGIGRPDDLRGHGIDPVHELPGVGQGLADHPVVINEFDLAGDEGLTRHLRADRAAIAAWRWYRGKPSPFGYTGTLANVFARSEEGIDRPDMQMMCLPLSGDARVWLKKPVSRLSVRTGYLRLKSRGWVRLRSPDPRDPPRIFLNLFSAPGDLDGMIRSLRFSRSVYAQSPLKELIARENLPGADQRSDAELAEWIRHNATHRAHPASSCRMGNDENAVVDLNLRVRGIEGLRIADASIMPTLPCGNPNLACMMIGEKAADLIRGRRLLPDPDAPQRDGGRHPTQRPSMG